MTMVITWVNQTAEDDSGLDAQNNAGDDLVNAMTTEVDLAQRMKQLTSLVETYVGS
jgi:hypothetical protein